MHLILFRTIPKTGRQEGRMLRPKTDVTWSGGEDGGGKGVDPWSISLRVLSLSV